MNNIQKLIIEIEDRKKLHEQNYRNGKINYSNWQGRKTECNFFIQSLNLLLNEQPEAITDDAQFRKHDVSGSAASEETSNVGDLPGASSSETATVSGNEQTKEYCDCNLTKGKCDWSCLFGEP